MFIQSNERNGSHPLRSKSKTFVMRKNKKAMSYPGYLAKSNNQFIKSFQKDFIEEIVDLAIEKVNDYELIHIYELFKGHIHTKKLSVGSFKVMVDRDCFHRHHAFVACWISKLEKYSQDELLRIIDNEVNNMVLILLNRQETEANYHLRIQRELLQS